ncbi:MAG: hypothetical protein AB1491_00130 [Thermodesulfobacteriota bacterium]
MAYGTYDKLVMAEPEADAKFTPLAVDAVAADKFVFTAREPLTVTRFGLEITTAYANQTTKQKVSLDKRVTHNSETGRVELAEIELQNGYADGHIYYKNLNSIDLDVGQQLVIEQKVAGAGSSVGGACNPFFCYHRRAEVAANQPYMHNLT